METWRGGSDREESISVNQVASWEFQVENAEMDMIVTGGS
jgi:hypothetical protein